MIDWIMDTSQGDAAVWQSVNHTTINSLGLEADLQFKVQSSKFKVSYSYIHQDKGQQPGIVSQYALEYLRHKLVANAQMPLTDRLSFSLSGRWQDRVGSYTDFDGTIQDYRPYFLLDTRLTWQQPTWKLYLEATNLLDTRYHDYGLVTQPGRWLIAGFSISL
jgi:iron complex outermembrane receptor protein